MKLTNILLVLAFAAAVVAELSLKELLSSCEKHQLSLLSKESLFLGKLYYVNGILRNVRFFHDDLKKWTKQDEACVVKLTPVKDTALGEADASEIPDVTMSLNPNLSLIVRLFPSPAGFIEPKTSLFCNFGRVVSQHFTEEYEFSGIRFLAFTLYYNSLTKEQKENIKVSYTQLSELSKRHKYLVVKVGSTEFKFKLETVSGKFFDIAKKSIFDTLHLLFDPKYGDSSDVLLNKSLIIQAFIVQLLENESQYERFMSSFKEFQTEFKFNVENFEDHQELLAAFTEVIKASHSFPYSLIAQPSQVTTVSPYCRKEHKFFKGSFPNCVESAIYHFLNCLFWNPIDMAYHFSPNIDAKNDVVEFFSSVNEMKGNLKRDQWQNWHRLVEDLENGYLCYNYQDDYLFTKVSYVKEFQVGGNTCLNELDPGFINLFKVLAVLFGVEDFQEQMRQCFTIDNGAVKLSEYNFKKFVEKFLNGIVAKDAQINISCSDLKIEYSTMNKKPDVTGKITVKRTFGSKSVTFSFVATRGHSHVKINQMIQPKVEFLFSKSIVDQFATFTDSRSLVPLYFCRSLNDYKTLQWKSPISNDFDNYLYDKFFLFDFGDDYETFKYLRTLYEVIMIYIIKGMASDASFDRLISIVSNIIRSLVITDRVIFINVDRFYELAKFLSDATSGQEEYPNIALKFSESELLLFSKVAEKLNSNLPKTNQNIETVLGNVEWTVKKAMPICFIPGERILGCIEISNTLDFWMFALAVRCFDFFTHYQTWSWYDGMNLPLTLRRWELFQIMYALPADSLGQFKVIYGLNDWKALVKDMLSKIPGMLNGTKNISSIFREDLTILLIVAWKWCEDPADVPAIVKCIESNMSERIFLCLYLLLDEAKLNNFSQYFGNVQYSKFTCEYLMKIDSEFDNFLSNYLDPVEMSNNDFGYLKKTCQRLLCVIKTRGSDEIKLYSPSFWYFFLQVLHFVRDVEPEKPLRYLSDVISRHYHTIMNVLEGIQQFCGEKCQCEFLIEYCSEFKPATEKNKVGAKRVEFSINE